MCVVVALSVIYVALGDAAVLSALFVGLALAMLAIVVHRAVCRVGTKR